MTTIEERAKNYSNIALFNKGWKGVAEEGYIQGAKEQQKIDIDKAYEWLKNKMHLDQQAFCDENYRPIGNCLEMFKKAMEE